MRTKTNVTAIGWANKAEANLRAGGPGWAVGAREGKATPQ